jgi:prepilin-type N-terminal cleavage/methylation domain-containing protein
MTQRLDNRIARSAFTLVEMLVVIAIIAILAALGTWGYFAMIGNQQRRNTESTIKVVNKVLQDHWKLVKEEADRESPSSAVIALAQPDPTGERAKVLWRKFRLMEAFPQSFAEIGTSIVANNAGTPWIYWDPVNKVSYIPDGQKRYISDYQKNLANLVAAKTNSNTASVPYAATPSSACLLLALTVNRGGLALNQDQIKFAVKDTDGDGIPEIVDGWSHPLAFTRFDTSAGVQTANPATGNVATPNNWTKPFKYSDPADPEGTLINTSWYFVTPPPNTPNPLRVLFETKFHAIALTAPPAANPRSNYVLASIESAGKDGKMQTADDIISYQLRGN